MTYQFNIEQHLARQQRKLDKLIFRMQEDRICPRAAVRYWRNVVNKLHQGVNAKGLKSYIKMMVITICVEKENIPANRISRVINTDRSTVRKFMKEYKGKRPEPYLIDKIYELYRYEIKSEH